MGFQTRRSAAMFRPENVELSVEPPPADGDRRWCPAVITDKKHIGWVVKYQLKCDDGVVRVTLEPKLLWSEVCVGWSGASSIATTAWCVQIQGV